MKKSNWGIIIFLSIIGLCVFIYARYEINYRERWTSRTSPLPAETIQDLCDRIELDDNNKLCRLEKDVYAGDFYSVIEEKIQPKGQAWMNYDQVNELFGAYIWDECYKEEDITCIYDLRGDRVATFAVIFNLDGEIKKTFWHVFEWD